MKYRKKPVVIEAVQWTGLNIEEVRDFIGEPLQVETVDSAWKVGKMPPVVKIIISTLEGDMLASKGDYIIKGVQGEFYPCKPDIFETTYEEVGGENNG